MREFVASLEKDAIFHSYRYIYLLVNHL